MLSASTSPIEPVATVDPAALPLRLLVVAPELETQELACAANSAGQFTVCSASTLGEARRLLAQRAADVVLLDVALPNNAALTLLDEITNAYPRSDVIVVTGLANVATAMDAMRMGASDYLTRPFTADNALAVLGRARQRLEQDVESRRLREQLRTATGMGPIIGTSAGMEKLYRILSKVALSQHPVLVVGESGTGKELVARFMHSIGQSAKKPFLSVACGTSTATPIESELFGHVKAALPGAGRSKEGALVAAGGGVVFLDEVGELTNEVQAKLVRALIEKQVWPMGAAQAVPFSARVIAGSSRDLAVAVEQGQFRKDLYFRLNVVKLSIPAIRERREDIPMLARHFVENVQRQRGVRFRFSDAALRLLCGYDWPGNVRELQSAIERTCAMSSGPVLHTVDLPTQLQDFQAHLRADAASAGKETQDGGPAPVVPIADMEKQAILSTIQRLNGDKLMAAKLLGIGKTTLYRKLKEYGEEC